MDPAEVPLPSIEVTSPPGGRGTCLTCLRELSEHQVECPEHQLLELLWPPNSPKFETDGIHTLGMERDFLATSLEYLRLCANELQTPLQSYRTLHLPGPTPATMSLYTDPRSWKFHWSSSFQTQRPVEQWGFRFGRGSIAVLIEQHLPPISWAIRPFVMSNYYSASSLFAHLGLDFSPQPQSQSQSQSPSPSPSQSQSESQPSQLPPQEEQEKEREVTQPFTIDSPEIQHLDRASCLSEWTVLRDILRAEVSARGRNATNLNSIAALFWRVYRMSLDPQDSMWSIIADLRAALARETADLDTARRNLGGVEKALEMRCWGVPAASGSGGEDNGEEMDIDGGNDEGGKGKGKGKGKETAVEGGGNETQNHYNYEDDVYIWTTRDDFAVVCMEEWERHCSFGKKTPVVQVTLPGGRAVLAVRWQLTG